MYIPVSENGIKGYSEGFVVKFFKSDKTEWVANFQVGWTDFNHVRSFKETDLIMVIAGGTCYLMHPDEQKPKEAYGVGFKSILERENGGFVLEDSLNLTVFDENGTYWDTERISWDGLKELKLVDNIVTGLSYEPTSDDDLWIEFSLNLDTKEIIGGSYNQIFGNKKKIKKARSIVEKKAWWKIW